jgi:putative membrane protein
MAKLRRRPGAAMHDHEERTLTRAKLPMLLAASVLALGFAACSPENPASEAVPTETALDDTTTETAVDPGVTNFVEKASLSNMYEIEAGKLALERSKVKEVTDFAQMMVDAHTASLSELTTLSSAAMVTPPSALDNDHTGKLEALRNASVEDFDDVYIDQQTEAHENTLNLVKDFAANGKDAGLQAFAAKMQPTVEQHLATVKALDDSPADDKTKSPSET